MKIQIHSLVLTHVACTRRLRLPAVQIEINVTGRLDLAEHAGVRVHHVHEARVRAIELRAQAGGGEERQRRIQSGQPVEQLARGRLHHVGRVAGDVCAQTEADQVQALEGGSLTAGRRWRRRWRRRRLCGGGR